ncbi:RHS repeat-associated core domain-containing protein [Exilibacterium tricleocarpae]|uniref:RHS repeat-associated core domain-containing protein n=1 Tax=Exilibacterium tricleocarpae TaxID=2591008 RepID=A0A545SNF3_9GAMM|nr:RHS repeat-associated core domain-containing protein [Exilibacterium tricleocarpae]TQV66513.1 RHS repeat-associated core domain-containing protein [Exilibacterium tricleocarpae]
MRILALILVLDVYGFNTVLAGETMESHRFIGERPQGGGSMLLNTRYYDPVLARFISADPSAPLADGVGLNRYTYGFNNPVSLKDPTGLAASGEGGEGDRGRGLSEPSDSDLGEDGSEADGGDADAGFAAAQAINDFLDEAETVLDGLEESLQDLRDQVQQHEQAYEDALEESDRLQEEGKFDEARDALQDAITENIGRMDAMDAARGIMDDIQAIEGVIDDVDGEKL